MSFFVYFTLYVFLHPSCSVVLSYFMFIPVYVILLFSVTVFQSTCECNKFLCHEDLISVKSVCNNDHVEKAMMMERNSATLK